MPSAHGTQADSFVLPSVARNVPAAQSAHVAAAEAPEAPENLPLPHRIQSLCASWPSVSRYVPGVQRRHALAPADSENVPVVQLAHVDAAEAPDAPENLPAAQLMQLVAPPSLPGVKYHGATKPDLEPSL